MYPAHLTQTGSNKLVGGNRQVSVEQYIEEVKGLAKLLHLLRGAQVNEAMDSGWFGWQVVV